jgi:uncharacterized protein YgiB involved in biofilm formation
MTRGWLAICLAVALAGVLALAETGWTQCGGYGYGASNRRSQACQTGWQGTGGPGYTNCPNYQANSYCAQGYGNNGRGARRARGNYRNTYNNSQSSTTPSTPENQ